MKSFHTIFGWNSEGETFEIWYVLSDVELQFYVLKFFIFYFYLILLVHTYSWVCMSNFNQISLSIWLKSEVRKLENLEDETRSNSFFHASTRKHFSTQSGTIRLTMLHFCLVAFLLVDVQLLGWWRCKREFFCFLLLFFCSINYFFYSRFIVHTEKRLARMRIIWNFLKNETGSMLPLFYIRKLAYILAFWFTM